MMIACLTQYRPIGLCFYTKQTNHRIQKMLSTCMITRVHALCACVFACVCTFHVTYQSILRCNTLQHTATRCHTLLHTPTQPLHVASAPLKCFFFSFVHTFFPPVMFVFVISIRATYRISLSFAPFLSLVFFTQFCFL